MLYHFASPGFLQGLRQLVTDLIDGKVDPLLALAHAEGRTLGPTHPYWGRRDPFTNWTAHGWDFLAGLRIKLADDIAKRHIGVFRSTDVSNSLRRGDDWLVPYISQADEERYEALERLLGLYADPIDTMFSAHQSPWSDFHFAVYAPFFASLSPQVARCCIRPEITAETGQLAPRTGVYMSASDPHASLQFAVAGPKGLALRPASTFNEVGLDALRAVGRSALWFDEQKMLRFALYSRHAALFKQVYVDGLPTAALAPSVVCWHAFTERTGSWHFVEAVDGQCDSIAIGWSEADLHSHEPYAIGGEFCQIAGWYRTEALLDEPSWRALFSHARDGTRMLLQVGQQMPIAISGDGPTLWRWDANQSQRP